MADPSRAELPPPPADPARKRKRRLRIALAGLALLIVTAAAAAPVGSRIVRSQLETRIEEMLAVELELESLELGLSGASTPRSASWARCSAPWTSRRA